VGDRLATIDMGRKEGAAVPLSWGELGPHLTQCGLGQGLPLYQVWPQQTWPEDWGGDCAPLGEGELGPHLTQSSLGWHLDPSSRLATTDMGRKLGGLCPIWGEEPGPHLTQCGQGQGLPPY